MRVALALLLFVASATAAPLDDLARKAAAGDTQAEHVMGLMHISGKGAEQSDAQALEWFLRAARKGHADSQHNAAVIFERTEGSL